MEIEKANTVCSVRLLHIAYSEQTAGQKPEGFELLSNLENARPDWFEYWPIRNWLLATDLGQADFVGFFSPRFTEKTGLASMEIRRWFTKKCLVPSANGSEPIALFSPQPEISAFFRNPFEAEDYFSPGFLRCTSSTFEALGIDKKPEDLVIDSSMTVFSNYWIAPKSFIQAWFDLAERLFAICELDSIQAAKLGLLCETNYPGNVEFKVFMMERLASMVLFLDSLCEHPKWRPVAYNPFKLASSALFHEFKAEAVICDGLKRAYRQSGYPEYLLMFESIRNPILQTIRERHR